MQNKIERRELFERKESWAFPVSMLGAVIASVVLILLFFSDPRARQILDLFFK
jgi:hypothetical protein